LRFQFCDEFGIAILSVYDHPNHRRKEAKKTRLIGFFEPENISPPSMSMHNSEAKATVFGGFQLLDPRIFLPSRYLFLNNSTNV
jgi:hypothetical protein